MTSFITQASSKPSLDLVNVRMRKWLIYAIWSCWRSGLPAH